MWERCIPDFNEIAFFLFEFNFVNLTIYNVLLIQHLLKFLGTFHILRIYMGSNIW